MPESLIGLASTEAESYISPKSAIDRIKNLNERVAPITTVISLFLIIEGWTRKDWNQIALGASLAVPSYYGLGEVPPEISIQTVENSNTETIIYNPAESSQNLP